jgi:hypothetical protein
MAAGDARLPDPEPGLGQGAGRRQQAGPPAGTGEDQPVRWRGPVRVSVAAEEPGLQQFCCPARARPPAVPGVSGQRAHDDPGDQVRRWAAAAGLESPTAGQHRLQGQPQHPRGDGPAAVVLAHGQQPPQGVPDLCAALVPGPQQNLGDGGRIVSWLSSCSAPSAPSATAGKRPQSPGRTENDSQDRARGRRGETRVAAGDMPTRAQPPYVAATLADRAALHRTDRISRRPPLAGMRLPAPADPPAGLPHMPNSPDVGCPDAVAA